MYARNSVQSVASARFGRFGHLGSGTIDQASERTETRSCGGAGGVPEFLHSRPLTTAFSTRCAPSHYRLHSLFRRCLPPLRRYTFVIACRIIFDMLVRFDVHFTLRVDSIHYTDTMAQVVEVGSARTDFRDALLDSNITAIHVSGTHELTAHPATFLFFDPTCPSNV